MDLSSLPPVTLAEPVPSSFAEPEGAGLDGDVRMGSSGMLEYEELQRSMAMAAAAVDRCVCVRVCFNGIDWP